MSYPDHHDHFSFEFNPNLVINAPPADHGSSLSEDSPQGIYQQTVPTSTGLSTTTTSITASPVPNHSPPPSPAYPQPSPAQAPPAYPPNGYSQAPPSPTPVQGYLQPQYQAPQVVYVQQQPNKDVGRLEGCLAGLACCGISSWCCWCLEPCY